MTRDCCTIIRLSVDFARMVVIDGGRLQPLAKGHAEVINAKGEAIGYLTKRQFKRYQLYYDSFTHYSDQCRSPRYSS